MRHTKQHLPALQDAQTLACILHWLSRVPGHWNRASLPQTKQNLLWRSAVDVGGAAAATYSKVLHQLMLQQNCCIGQSACAPRGVTGSLPPVAEASRGERRPRGPGDLQQGPTSVDVATKRQRMRPFGACAHGLTFQFSGVLRRRQPTLRDGGRSLLSRGCSILGCSLLGRRRRDRRRRDRRRQDRLRRDRPWRRHSNRCASEVGPGVIGARGQRRTRQCAGRPEVDGGSDGLGSVSVAGGVNCGARGGSGRGSAFPALVTGGMGGLVTCKYRGHKSAP